MHHLVFCSLLALAAGYANPGPCSGDCWTHDPGFYQRKSDGKYFRFATGAGIYISSADALTGPWTAVGEALPGGSQVDHAGNTSLWAPDIHYESASNLYYMYYSISTLGSQDSIIGVASSPNLQPGSWTDHGALLSSSSASPFNAIDPNWISIDGTPRLSFGSYWHDLFQVPLTSATSLGGSGGAPAVQIAYNASANHNIEASFVFYRRGWYYLLFSSGRANGYDTSLPAPGGEYRIVVCRSRSGTGDFVDRTGTSCLQSGGTTLLASHGTVYAPGGQGSLRIPRAAWCSTTTMPIRRLGCRRRSTSLDGIR
ncbi:hypothetical protein ARAM_007590 [Aspergillus rambellii]|uniref:arabinan endo-1,5-alpha-L-arabinosidase n=1 Tax=Aspergillus rambellii TaxID=308745 RepID=A0A0F8U354_9EURO|nr:hypothetical protein ARAM_007590 [Aspergillus rambellii]